MHELMACTASLIILTLLIAQTAANTNTFIRAAYCERVISEFAVKEYDIDEIQDRTDELKERLEKMPGVGAETEGKKLSVRLDGVIGPADALGIKDNSILIEKDLTLSVKEKEDEKPDDDGGDTDDPGAAEPLPDGDDSHDINDDLIYG